MNYNNILEMSIEDTQVMETEGENHEGTPRNNEMIQELLMKSSTDE
eukprot:CAMPEP_0176342656 /NCGR_PEP_ID=MMETSP0126-20121128/3339_1 /TAXON_ID=141414 ORGANISM="Strombidinopsis acuminatum, Strain SPMC142" /NCGR_SAMPLE_ID=MMETSP0126 /ASSEMBLY_ACC=CAM_ASM_000229 /LENGTH=45 /DNA_ID= /DNA_START= /DNA_END= /DNA_ORIENTATION=